MLLSFKWHLIEHLNKLELWFGVTSKFTHSLFYQKVSCSFFATTCSHPFKVPVGLFKAISNEPRCPFQSLLGGHGLKSFIWQKLKEIEWNCNLALWNDRYLAFLQHTFLFEFAAIYTSWAQHHFGLFQIDNCNCKYLFKYVAIPASLCQFLLPL